MAQHANWLVELLQAAEAASVARDGRRPVFFDIGARDGLSPLWDMLARLGMIRAIGFEPDHEHAEVLARRDPHVSYQAKALGVENGELRFYLTRMPGCSSFREPNYDLLSSYPASTIFDLVGTRTLQVTPLSDLIKKGDVPPGDFLKIDTQGFEMEILRGAGTTLDNVVGIELEAQFKSMYKGQALLPEIKAFLEQKGFILRELRPNGPYEGEVLEVDAFFSRRPALDDNIELLRFWQLATELNSPKFLSQMTDWEDEWLGGLTDEQIALRQRLFGE